MAGKLELWVITSTLILAVAAVIVGGTELYQSKDPYLIYGYVTYTDGTRVSNASVTAVEAKTGQTKHCKTDESGKYNVVFEEYEIGDQIRVEASDGNKSSSITAMLKKGTALLVNVSIAQYRTPGLSFYELLAIMVTISLIYKYRLPE